MYRLPKPDRRAAGPAGCGDGVGAARARVGARGAFHALTRPADAASIGGMADQKQEQDQKQNKPPGNAGNLDNDDNPRHAPESGEPTETGTSAQQGSRGKKSGERDESGRQGSGH